MFLLARAREPRADQETPPPTPPHPPHPPSPPHPPLPLGGDAISPLHQYLATAPEPRYDQNGLQDAHFEHSLTLGLGFEVLGLGFEVLGLGCDVLGLGFSVLRLGFEVLSTQSYPDSG